MENFALLFRMDISGSSRPSPKQMELYMEQWERWIGEIRFRGELVSGNHFSTEGVVLRPGNVTEQLPFNADGVGVAGYIIISVRNLKGAIATAQKCPILNGKNTSVEIRKLASPGQ